MKLIQDPNYKLINVVLSRRNLKSLLAMLDEPTHKTKSIGKSLAGQYVIVRAEEDDAHYGDTPPGLMTPAIEGALKGQEMKP